MILEAAACALFLSAPHTAPVSVLFCPLEKSVRNADLVVSGRIAAIRTPRSGDGGWTSGGEYELEVGRVFAGRAREGARLAVQGCGDWTCEARSVEYAVGQELFLLLDRDGKALRPVYGFQSEFILEGDRIRQSNYRRGFGAAGAFLDGLPAILAFAALPRAEQPAAWVGLLRHPNAEVRQFALRRFHEIHFLEEGSRGGAHEDPYAAMGDDVLLSLFAETVRLIPEDPTDRGAAIRALEYLWAHIRTQRPHELRERTRASRLEAIARLATPSPATAEEHRAESLYARATLGSLDDLPPVLEVLRAPDHDRHFEALAALEALADTAGLRRRSAIDALADHPEGTRCEAALGRSALSLVRASGTEPSFQEGGMDLRETARAFRVWWARHRSGFRE